MTQDLHVVLGATGGIGASVVAALQQQGHAVRAVNRSGDAATTGERLAADVSTPAGAARAVAGAAVVYHCAQPEYTQWHGQFAAMNAAVADACEQVGAKLVFADNLYMYEPVGDSIGENSAQRPTSKKGRLRKQLADELMARHAAGRQRVTIGRASDYYGPGGADSTPAALVFEPLAKGKRPRWMGSLDAAHTLHYLPDVGRALVALGNDDHADGRVWVLPAAQALTGRQWVQAAIESGGRSGVTPGLVTPFMNRLAGLFIPIVREMNEIMYQFAEPFVVDDRAFRTTFPAVSTTEPTLAVKETVEWFAEQAQPAA